ncbi:MAG: ACR3 family arsenite efflux transporter [Endomicrobiaceae bacterium]|nr:ACR3 family arsenite efflux transporter [Endomicrobiaceae bacterium]
MSKSDSVLGFFERYLSIWIALAIVIGILFGNLFPDLIYFFSKLEYAHVNIPIAILIWFMIYPMMIQIDFNSIKNIRKEPKGLILTLVVNWAVKPFTMALLAMLFFKYIFAGFVSAQEAKEYIAGMILLGVAPCTAMVFVWSQLTKGNPNYTLVQVAVNDLVMIFLFAPITGLLLGVSDIVVPWNTLFMSVFLYVVIPLSVGYYTRKLLDKKQKDIDSFVKKIKPFSIIGLIATVVLLFAFQAETIILKPAVIILIAVPLLIQSYGIFAVSYFAAKKIRLPFDIAAPAAMIGTSNFFELAVAVAISLFGLNSGAALATVVGVLVEVPVMLSLVSFANKTQRWFK